MRLVWLLGVEGSHCPGHFPPQSITATLGQLAQQCHSLNHTWSIDVLIWNFLLQKWEAMDVLKWMCYIRACSATPTIAPPTIHPQPHLHIHLQFYPDTHTSTCKPHLQSSTNLHSGCWYSGVLCSLSAQIAISWHRSDKSLRSCVPLSQGAMGGEMRA